MEEKVSEKEIKRVVREYIERVLKHFESKIPLMEGSIDDDQIDCPQCGSARMFEFDSSRGEWRSLHASCRFTFIGLSESLTPPSPKELKEHWERKKLEEKIQIFLKSK